MPNSLFVGINICTDCVGGYNGYKTRKHKTYRPVGYKSVYHKPTKTAKDKIEPLNCSPYKGPDLGPWLTKSFKVKKNIVAINYCSCDMTSRS
jgi:hypothetical protein